MALSAYAITTLANVKEYMGISVSTYDTVLEHCIDRASDLIDRYCNRNFRARTRTNKLFWSDGSDTINLAEYPVTSVGRVCLGAVEALKVSNSSADAGYITVRCNTGIMVLTVVGGANAGITSFTLADYTDLDALETAIDSTGSGWSSTVLSNKGAFEAIDLFDQGAFEANDAEPFLEIPDLPLQDHEFFLDAERGVIHFDNQIERTCRIFITYTAGWVQADIPYSLEQAAIELAVNIYRKRKSDGGMKSEKLGDYSYTRFDTEGSIPPSVLFSIAPFRRLFV